jgi:ComF family protein
MILALTRIEVLVVSMPFIRASQVRNCRPIQTLVDSILNLVYPDSCIICAAPISCQKDRGVCENCWKKTCALKIQTPYCPSCGLPFQAFNPSDNHLCSRCILETPPFSGARSFGFYAAELSSLIQHFKFHGRRNLDELLAHLMAQAFSETWAWSEFDLIVPVPLHPERRRERGYNQAALLARCLSHHIGIPDHEFLLRRVRPTISQVGLTDEERFRNLRRAFECTHGEQAHGMRLLLVDDVMTTGATASSASETLVANGAVRVSVLTVARAVPGVE